MSCDTCKDRQTQELSMNERELLARKDRTIGRLIIAYAVTVVLLVGMFLYAWLQYDYYSEETTVEAKDGIANYIGQDGDIYNGQDYSEAPSAQEKGR